MVAVLQRHKKPRLFSKDFFPKSEFT